MITINANNERVITLGYRGEKNVRKVVFDISDLKATYGDGEASLTNLRVGEYVPYNVTNCKVSDDGNSLEWLVNDTDTGKAGKYGSCQLTYTVDNAVAMTKTWQTEVYKSLTPTGKAPEPYYSWLTDVKETAKSIEDKITEAKEYVADINNAINGIPEQIEHINSSVISAREYSNEALYYKGCAENAKADAEKSALLAQEAAEAIKNTAAGANQITPTAEGGSIVLSDSADSPIVKAKIYGNESVKDPTIKLYGKNLIEYPYINTTKTQEGVAYTDNGDGTITIKGTPSGYSDFKLCYFYEKGKFTIGGVDTYNNVSIGIVLQDVNQNTIATINKQQNQPKITFDTSEYPDYYRGLVQIKRNANNIAIDTVIRPQIEVGELATEYETYKAPQALGFMGYSLHGIKDDDGNWIARDEIVCDGDSVKHIQRLSANSGALTVLAFPIETDITDTEAGQVLLALRTHYPTTTVMSDTDVAITYVADTKNYIDNKFNTLAAAIVAQ